MPRAKAGSAKGRAKARADAKAAAARGKRAKHAARFDASIEKLKTKIQQCRRHGVGCCYCKRHCLTEFEPRFSDLRAYRREFRDLPDETARDIQISWLFCEAPKAVTRQRLCSSTIIECDTSDSEPPQFCTSDEGRSPGFQTSSDADVPVATSDAKRLAASNAKRRATSNAQTPIAKASSEAAFETSTEDGDGDVCAASGSEGEAEVTPPKATSVRNGKHAINIMGHTICFHAARAVLGLGTGRLMRVRQGAGDGRRLKQPRGPQGISLKPDSATMSCLTFLWRVLCFDRCAACSRIPNPMFHAITGPMESLTSRYSYVRVIIQCVCLTLRCGIKWEKACRTVSSSPKRTQASAS